MPKKLKTKYHLRPDGRIETTKVINGKQRHFYGHSDEEVDAKIAAAEAEAERPVTVSDLAEAWWTDKQERISPNTYSGFNTAVRRIKEHFSNMAVVDVTPADVYVFLDVFRALNYSQKVISNTRSVLKMIFDLAIIRRIITLNPVPLSPPVKGKEKVPREPAADRDIEIIEAHKTEDMAARFYYFVLYTGLRRNEAICLTNADINRQAHSVKVDKNVAYRNSIPVLKSTKSKAGIRSAYLPDNVIEVLPPEGPPDDLIWFPGGELPHKSKGERFIKSFQLKYGITSTPHQLRHSYASLLHTANVDVLDASKLLGHKDASVTQNIYTHLENKQRKIATGQIDAEISSRNIVKAPQTSETQ